MQPSRRAFATAKRHGVCLVIGAGDANGAAVSRAFAQRGFDVCIARRNAEKLEVLRSAINDSGSPGKAHAFQLDARVEDEVIRLIEIIESTHGPIECCVHNIGANVNFSVAETTVRVYQKVWELTALSSFIVGREMGKRMAERGRGSIIFTGATASIRGGSGYAAFSGGMFAKRALAQSMARELGPAGVHVAHVVIDGAIDTPWIRKTFPEKAVAAAAVGGLLEPDQVAANYVYLHEQPKSAWTHELDLRPYCEKW